MQQMYMCKPAKTHVLQTAYLGLIYILCNAEETEVYELEEGEWIPEDDFVPSDSVEGVTLHQSVFFRNFY